MNLFGVFLTLRTFFVLGLVALFAMALFVAAIWGGLAREASYRHRFGDGWQVEFEKDHGSLAQQRSRIALAGVGVVAIPSILFWLYKILRPSAQKPRARRAAGSREPQQRVSRIERIVRYRRNALLGNYFGVPGILAGVLLNVVNFGIFENPDNQQVFGLFVFLGGYLAVVAGCRWWLKAKAWTEAIIFIAFMPLVVFFIPFVRLFFFANPAIICVSMVMTPLILVVVVFVLPDNSHVPKKRPVWDWNARNKINDRAKE